MLLLIQGCYSLDNSLELLGHIIKSSLLCKLNVFLQLLELVFDFCHKFILLVGYFGDHGLAKSRTAGFAV